MSSATLSQEEIDRLLNPSSAAAADGSGSNLSQMETDIIGEVGNISMSQAATTLSELLGHQVTITTPKVKTMKIKEILAESYIPKVVTSIEFKKGITGRNMLILDVQDSAAIANLMMGGDGLVSSATLTDLELSAVGEAMNQMIGSASTAMATMLGRIVDIYPPDVRLWDEENDYAMEQELLEEEVCEISFELQVQGILKSTIMQVFSMDAVHDISEIMLGDEAIVVADHQQAQPIQKEEPAERVAVQKPEFQALETRTVNHAPKNLDLIMDVPLEFSVMLGESQKTIRDILSLGTGSVVELDKMTEEPLSIYVNGKMIAEGEVVVINENFGIRITNILSKEKRLKNL